jgi:lipase maturation factor 1
VVFAVAFLSLLVQVRGLIGAQGIVPATDFLKAVGEHFGSGASWKMPTVFWLGATDSTLVAVAWLGVIASAVLAAGFAPAPMALLCWALYLSFCTVASPFLDFQWDILLLETALLAALALPWRLRPRWSLETPLQRTGRWLLWWLVFRFMFESGLVKLTWNDSLWLEMRALAVHFETQPIPHPIAWYVHQLPGWMLQVLCVGMFAIELLAPFLIVAPRRWRHGAAIAFASLQFGIAATGNFAFFNWLSIALCLLLLDDSFWPPRIRERLAASLDSPAPAVPRWKWAACGVAAALIVVATIPGFVSAFNTRCPDPIGSVLGQFRSFNGYGLFRVMTPDRPEIVVEGSRDGATWLTYKFKWKPGDLYSAPPFVAPHQPRLDWQMWFAALGDVRQNPWFVNFLVRLLQGSPDVLSLLEENPFPNGPPRYVRAVRYDYRFTRGSDHTAAWWKREQKDLYCPAISLKETIK